MFESVGKETVGSAIGGCAVAVGLVGAGVAIVVAGGWWWWNRVPSEAPPVSYGLVVADAPIGGVDLARVHLKLWPRWVIARDPAGRAEAAQALVAALQPDPALVEIAADLLAAPDAGSLPGPVGVWNAAMAARGAAWSLGAGVDVSPPYVKSYRVLARPTVRIGTRETPVRVALRADGLNVTEGWLGVAEDVGDPIVVVDRVADFAFDALWPALDPASPEPGAAALQAASRAALGDAVVDRLVATAPARRAMVAARDAIEDRRRSCGSDFRIRFGWAGLDHLGALYAWADEERGRSCPGLLWAEADALARGSDRIRRDPELPAALEALAGWAARNVAIHEAAVDAAIGAPCDAAPPPDLARRAADLDQQWFQADGGATVTGLPPRLSFALAPRPDAD